MNDEAQYAISCRHIEALSVPAGWETERVAVRGAASLAGGYNRGMREARGRIKVYLHQDVRILNRHLLADLGRLFDRYPHLGLIGVIGAVALPPSGIWWEGSGLVGKVYANPGRPLLLAPGPALSPFTPVEAVDGLFLATAYDLPWREDLFDGWHFYDASQCQEFRRAGYQVGVPPQPEPWCYHDSGPTSLDGYELYRLRFVRYYRPGAGAPARIAPSAGPGPSGRWRPRAGGPAGRWGGR